MMTTRLILIRHGETEWNVAARYQGQKDSPLTATGQAQAEALAERLATHPFQHLYSSDLGRARATAEFIAARTGHPIQTRAGLRERSFGIFEGSTQAEVSKLWPEEFAIWSARRADFTPPGGESHLAMTNRIVGAIDTLAGQHTGETLVVVTHGGALSAMLRHLLGLPAESPRRFGVPNAGWNVVAHTDQRWMVETWGDISHLGRLRALEEAATR